MDKSTVAWFRVNPTTVAHGGNVALICEVKLQWRKIPRDHIVTLLIESRHFFHSLDFGPVIVISDDLRVISDVFVLLSQEKTLLNK